MKIETSRLIVRDFSENDAKDLYEILGDAETMEFCEPAYDFEKTKKFLEEFCIARNGAAAAVHKQTDKMIGYILFNELEKGVYEIGWFFNRRYWRQGYAYEACKAVIEDAFRQGKARRIFAETIDPVKSAALMEKLGMKREELQRRGAKDLQGNEVDLYVYAIQKEDAI